MISPEACAEAAQQMAALTERERECVVLASKGLSTSEIASALGVAYGTVNEHLKHAFKRLDVNTRTEAAVIAAKAGLV